MRVAEFFTPEDHEIRQRDRIRHGSELLLKAIRRDHPERYVPAPLPVFRAVPQIAPVFSVPPIPKGYTLPPLPMKGAEVLRLVAETMEVSIEAIRGRSRIARIVHCRALVASTLRARGWSYPQIGQLLNRDHSTIINLCGKIDIYVRRSEDCSDVYKALKAHRRGG